jgi:hypothetical protein
MDRIVRFVIVALALAAGPWTVRAQSPAPAATVYIKAGHLFDATSDNLRENVVIVVTGERIAKVAPAAEVAIPAGATVVDLSKAWVLPGLIDCHTHLEVRADKYDPINEVRETPFRACGMWVRSRFLRWICGRRSTRGIFRGLGWWRAGRESRLRAVTGT